MTRYTRADAARWAARKAPARSYYHQRGPSISHTGLVVVPNAGPAPELKAALEAVGFWYSDFHGGWLRDDVKPHPNGQRYTAEQWLDWARRHYAKAWPWFEPKENDR